MIAFRSPLLFLSLGLALSAQAQITPISEFTGTLNEGFESYQNYLESPSVFLPSPASIMGGAATFSAENALVYEAGTDADFIIGMNPAGVHGGTKAVGLNDYAASATIRFADPVFRFGGFFNRGMDMQNARQPISFSFFDGKGSLIGTSLSSPLPEDGNLYFVGFASSVPISRIDYTGDYVVVDDLRADPVPEPLSGIALGLGTLAALRRRTRRG